VYVDGGRVISDFLAEGLIDDLALTTAPVLLGSGRPLFHPTTRSGRLRLEGVRSWPSGFVTRTYVRAPELEDTGSISTDVDRGQPPA
jgi:dihydrofolate reductase